MVTVNLTFTQEEVQRFFESAGLVVKEVTIPGFSKKMLGMPTSYPDAYFSVLKVVNPHTYQLEDLSTAFLRCVIKNKEGLVSDIEKLEIINSFK